MIQLLVPPAQSGGVFDFACKLQAELGFSNARLVHLTQSTAADWQIGPDDTVFLQMSGYGFDSRGAPLWLLRELQARRQDVKQLGIFFHELYAFGPPWSSSFWLSPVQRHIARRLAKLADFWMTSREGSAKWLRAYAPNKPQSVFPVFSTVGEIDSPEGSRTLKTVIFGSPDLRRTTYLAAGDQLYSWAIRAGMEIHDIGSPMLDTHLTKRLCAHGVIQHGHLEDRQISNLMTDSAFGLISYPVEFVAKSSVFAAYCAHGVCPILISKRYPDADRLTAGRQYIAGLPRDAATMAHGPAVGRAAWDWYQPHRLQDHLAGLRRLISTVGVY